MTAVRPPLRRLPAALGRAALFAVSAALVVLPIGAARPQVGHDYLYFLPRLADTFLFMRQSGLAVQWWTPTFGGGLPAFPNPQSLQFSLPQLLTFFVNPFLAVCASVAIATLASCYALHRLARRTLGFDEASACLLAVACSTGGFYILQMVVGHVGYHAFALIPLLLLLVVDRDIPASVALPAAGLTGAYFVYSGSYFASVLAVLGVGLAVPLVHLLTGGARDLAASLRVLLGAAIVGLGLAAAKLVAIASWLASFPRRTAADSLPSLLSPLLQLVSTPVATLAGLGGGRPSALHQALFRQPYGPWETDASLALPVVLGAYVFAGVLAARVLRRGGPRERWLLAAALAVGALILVLAAGRGPLFGALKAWPLLSTLRVNSRFSAALTLPVGLLGVAGLASLDRWCRARGAPPAVLPAAIGLALLQAAGYTALVGRQAHDLGVWLPVGPFLEFCDRLRADPSLAGPIHAVDAVNDITALTRSKSSLRVYEPLIGAFVENAPGLTDLVVGPATQVRDGGFNLHFPPAFSYPAYVGRPPFSRVPATDGANLRLFLERRPPRWGLPPSQRIANAVSLASLGLLGVFALWQLARAGRGPVPSARAEPPG